MKCFTTLSSWVIMMIGEALGRYHILEQLGEGGMATVYKAFDTRLEREVAVKVILPSRQQTPKFLKRFEREAKALAQLSHPNIVKILDYGEHDGLPFLVMEYTPGGTLKERLGEAMPWQEAASLLEPIARALEYAHERKIIHRDVKPSNILITASAEPMLSDFGIAKVLETEETWDLTGTGVGIGTPEYMAPEQGLGKAVDHRADIYALGIVFYELVTGRKPFQADTPMAVVVKHINDPLPRPKDFVGDLPKSVEQVIFKTLAKDPEDRFQDMRDFAETLEKLAKRQKVTVDGVPRAEGKRIQRPTVMVGLAAVALVMVVGATWAFRSSNSVLEAEQTAVALTMATVDPTRAIEFIQELTRTARSEKYATETQARNNALLTSTVITLTPTKTSTSAATVTPTPFATRLYDNFDDPANDGGFDTRFWTVYPDDLTSVVQKDGVLIVSQKRRPPDYGTSVEALKYAYFTMNKPMFFEADLMLDPDQHAGMALYWLKNNAYTSNQFVWWQSICIISSSFEASYAQANCWDGWSERGKQVDTYGSSSRYIDFGTWHTFRTEVDPTTMTFTYYLDGQVIGSHIPPRSSDLKDDWFQFSIGVYAPSSGAVTGYIDNVRIGQIEP